VRYEWAVASDDAPTREASRSRRLGRAAVYAGVTAVVFFGVGFLIRSKWDPLIDLDDRTIATMTAFTRDHPALLDALLVWQAVFLPRNLYVVGTLLCLWVWFGKGLRTRAWWAFGTMMFAWFIEFAGKFVFERARPVVEDPLSKAPGYSFPSGHALGGAAFATTVVILLWPIVESRAWRAVMITVAGVGVVLTALDRTYLGVHYPSDVTVGVVTGVGLVLASYAGYSGWNPPDSPSTARDPDATGAPREHSLTKET
jgi:membrane-associated phospholipid phosphatase